MIEAAPVSVVEVKPVPVPVTLTVIVVVPGATAVTTPVVAFTVATATFDVEYTLDSVTAAFARVTFGVTVTVCPTAICAADGETESPEIAAAGAATETDAAATWPVDAVAVIVALPAATAVTRQVEPATVAVTTVAELVTQLASVGLLVTDPPEIWTAKLTDSPTFIRAEGGVIESVIGASGVTGTVTSSPQAPSAKAPRLRATIALFREKSCIHPPLARSWR